MRIQRQIIAVAVVFCLFVVQSLVAATPFSPASIKQQANQLGPGAEVRLKLANGQKMTGSIQAIQDDGLLVTSKQAGAPKLVAYDEVAQLKLATRRYTAHDQANAIAARRVVTALGVGQHIVVKQFGGNVIHGHIQAVDADYFLVLPDHRTSAVKVAYGDIRHVEKNLSLGATIVLVVLIAAAVVVAATVAATR